MIEQDIQSDFQRVRERLSAYYERHEIDFWLRSPHPQLRDQRPCDMILQGTTHKVEALIDQLDSGAYT